MCKNKERGSALITVILVVLVLTMVGLASLLFMTTEERIASTSRLEKAAFYAAEVGLRRAERSVRSQFSINPTSFLNNALTYSPQTNGWNVLTVPNGGTLHQTAVVLTDALDPDLNQERVDPALQIIDPANKSVPATEMRGILVDNSQGYITTYNIYIRNDDEESAEDVDTNQKISIISVGLLVTPGGQVVRKVLEEEIAPIGALPEGFSVEKGANFASTNVIS